MALRRSQPGYKLPTHLKYKCDNVFHFVDADGTFYNEAYYQYRLTKNAPGYDEEKVILAANNGLLRAMAIRIKKALFGGQLSSFSMRQTPEIDALTQETALFCDTLKTLPKVLKSEFDPFLMGDICTNREPGASFESRDINFGKNAPKDNSKISMLYAKMQRIALNFYGQKNHIFVWDDNERVLQWLHDYFSQRPHLIPDDVVLNLMQVSHQDNSSKKFATAIHGTGTLNPLYRTVVRWFYQRPGYKGFEISAKDALPAYSEADMTGFFSELDDIHQALLLHQAALEKEFKEGPASPKVAPVSEVKSAPLQYDFSVHMLDADDVIFNSLYYSYKYDLKYPEEKAVFAANKKMIDSIVQDMQGARCGGQIESFSSRQTSDDDHQEAKQHKTSLFSAALSTIRQAIKKKAPRLYCKYEKYVMGDIYEKNAPTGCVTDRTKISMLYARMQRLANARPGKKVCITVWEKNPKILFWLSEFFSNNRLLVPAGLTLKFVNASDAWNGPKSFPELIEGTGEATPFYESVVRSYYQHASFQQINKAAVLNMLAARVLPFYQEISVLHQKAFKFANKQITRRFSTPFFLFQNKPASSPDKQQPQPNRYRSWSAG